ncbi:hypothetical protein [Schleiferilactobacillus perolens]|uniref:DUF5082 domain-containing protein n=1 Tax=Schleiferilactobacillus perolens DSM 12744 TaxID=1423792 RepID=A0A0R1N4J0_9LACO|nr:hypothetical protein [Schleiferilactobacillus perolens]KRL11643.1 hypothetical protein FD09_GL000565 [Schleiferilactobacillus perolens DSM 12744]
MGLLEGVEAAAKDLAKRMQDVSDENAAIDRRNAIRAEKIARLEAALSQINELFGEWNAVKISSLDHASPNVWAGDHYQQDYLQALHNTEDHQQTTTQDISAVQYDIQDAIVTLQSQNETHVLLPF